MFIENNTLKRLIKQAEVVTSQVCSWTSFHVDTVIQVIMCIKKKAYKKPNNISVQSVFVCNDGGAGTHTSGEIKHLSM